MQWQIRLLGLTLQGLAQHFHTTNTAEPLRFTHCHVLLKSIILISSADYFMRGKFHITFKLQEGRETCNDLVYEIFNVKRETILATEIYKRLLNLPTQDFRSSDDKAYPSWQ
jgi:hypothetical protein